MKSIKRFMAIAVLAVMLCTTVFSFCAFSSMAQEKNSFVPESIAMEVTAFMIIEGGGSNGDLVDIAKLNGAGNSYQGVLEIGSDGEISAYVPIVSGKYGMSVTSGSTTNFEFTVHSDSVSLYGNINDSKTPGNNMSVPCEASMGHFVAALLSGAEYQAPEGQEDDLERVADAINLASSHGFYECELDGNGSIKVDNTGDDLLVTLYLSASSYKYYVYGRLQNEGEGGGVRIMMKASDNVDLTPIPSGDNSGNEHDIITKPPTESGEFTGEKSINWILILVLLGGAAAFIKYVTSKKKKNEKPPEFKMILNKDFGDTIRKGDPPQKVYAKIVEIRGEKQIDRPDLTGMIMVSSYDNSLIVTDGGIERGYKCARASVPEDNQNPAGLVTFSLNSPMGNFFQSVMLKITVPEIFFMQENLGLPANKLKFAKAGKNKNVGDQTYRLPFGVREMRDDVRVKATLTKVMVTDIDGRIGNDVPKGMPFEVKIVQDKQNKFLFEAVIREILDYELPAGNTEGIRMHLVAEAGTKDTDTYQKVETDFPLYRIHLGLAFTLDADSIGCYMQVKPERQGMKYAYLTESERMGLGMITKAAGIPDLNTDSWGRGRTLGTDYEPCFAGGSLLLFLFREEDMSIVRMPVSPDSTKPLDVKAKIVTFDRYCHKRDAEESHQSIVDELKITAFGTGELLYNGAHKIRICSTKGALDPPIRILSELEIKVKYEGKEYSAKKDVLLRSQPFRIIHNEEENAKFIKEDEHIEERLLRIQDQIYRSHMLHLFSLYDLIDRMLSGYEFRYGYDANQVMNVMKIWTDYLEGNFAGANADAKKVTFADELEACYAFMQGLRDNTGFLGRVAMGIMTAGYSEYVFTTMTLAEEMRNKVFACKGDEDYGFWDGVCLGVKEFGKQVLIEYAIKGAIKGTQIYTKAVYDIDIAGYVNKIAETYRAKVDKFDMCLQKNIRLYKAGADALKKTKNFFNSSAKAAKKAIDGETVSYEESFAKAEELAKKSRSKMTPDELKLVDEYYEAMNEGMVKVRKLQRVQQRMEKATTPKELKLAKEQYKKIADEVWTDKNALKQLQNVKGEYAPRLRAQFNHYRENLLDIVQLEALDDIARETGIPRDNLYVMNASNGSKMSYKTGKKVPGDRDISFKQKVLSDRTKDLTINQSLGERTVARRLFKKMNGREADTIEEALEFMHGKDVTYVHPDGDSAVSYWFEHNLDGYEDLSGMIGMKVDGTIDKSLMGKDLHNKVINQKSVAHKGKEWFHMSDKSINKAISLEKEAAKLSGKEAEALIKEAKQLRYFAQGQTVEGVRQITKQINNIAIPRSIARNGMNAIPHRVMQLQRVALRVGDTLSPAEFIFILKNEYGLTLNSFADLMSRYVE